MFLCAREVAEREGTQVRRLKMLSRSRWMLSTLVRLVCVCVVVFVCLCFMLLGALPFFIWFTLGFSLVHTSGRVEDGTSTLPCTPPYAWGAVYMAASHMEEHLPGIPLSPELTVQQTEEGILILDQADQTVARVIIRSAAEDGHMLKARDRVPSSAARIPRVGNT